VTKLKPTWNFEAIGPNGYEEEGIAAFEVFNQQQTLDPLEVLVREAIQNSCDAKAAEKNPVEVHFELRELHGAQAKEFLGAIGYDVLQPHLEGTAAQEGTLQNRIEQDGLTQIDDLKLRIVTVADYGTTGLWGEEGVDEAAEGNFHKLVRAAMKTHEEGSSTQGGSFGLGKAIYWMTSGAATVMLHSIPSKSPNKGESRFIGRTWLPSHKTTDANGDERRWNNVGGWFGTPGVSSDGLARSVSIWGEEASGIAATVGIERKPGEYGTSFAIVAFDDPAQNDEPDVGETCDALEQHVIKWYWPALCEQNLTVCVKGIVGDDVVRDARIEVIPETDEQVGAYVAAWNRLQSDNEDGEVTFTDETFDWIVPKRQKKPEHEAIGVQAKIGVVISEAGGAGDYDGEFSSIALMRGATGMVVQYYSTDPVSRRYADAGRIFHGVLLTGKAHGKTEADTQLEMFLRATEPPAHDRWAYGQERVRREYHWKGGSALTAKTALNGYHDDINTFLLKQIDEPSSEGARGPDRLLKMLSFGKSGKPTPEKPKLIVRRGKVTPYDGEWRFEDASFGLNSTSKWDSSGHAWSFVLSVLVPEDGNKGSQRLPIKSISVGEDGQAVDFEAGADEVTVRANPGAARVTFSLEASLPDAMLSGTRTRRVAAQLNAVYSDDES
jgi:hypothetical protein